MIVLFSEAFVCALTRYNSIKKTIKRKVDQIIENPLTFGEPLKGNFRGFYSCPVSKNFLIIYLYCKNCRKKGYDKILLCSDCDHCSDNTIKFIALGPHDSAYGKK